jgi:hypothetical protein
VQNLISRLRFEAASDDGEPIAPYVEELIGAMLMADEVTLTDAITGSSGFREYFESLGPRDDAGRSLRQFDLQTRLFRYPLSYLIYSDAFQALPAPAKSAVYAELREVLARGPGQDEFTRLSSADRVAISEILRATLPAVFER